MSSMSLMNVFKIGWLLTASVVGAISNSTAVTVFTGVAARSIVYHYLCIERTKGHVLLGPVALRRARFQLANLDAAVTGECKISRLGSLANTLTSRLRPRGMYMLHGCLLTHSSESRELATTELADLAADASLSRLFSSSIRRLTSFSIRASSPPSIQQSTSASSN
jgi:hypothetical protein